MDLIFDIVGIRKIQWIAKKNLSLLIKCVDGKK